MLFASVFFVQLAIKVTIEFAKVNEAPNGSVEVGHETSQGFKYWTYYKSLQSCIDALPRSKQIPSKYE